MVRARRLRSLAWQLRFHDDTVAVNIPAPLAATPVFPVFNCQLPPSAAFLFRWLSSEAVMALSAHCWRKKPHGGAVAYVRDYVG